MTHIAMTKERTFCGKPVKFARDVPFEHSSAADCKTCIKVARVMDRDLIARKGR